MKYLLSFIISAVSISVSLAQSPEVAMIKHITLLDTDKGTNMLVIVRQEMEPMIMELTPFSGEYREKYGVEKDDQQLITMMAKLIGEGFELETSNTTLIPVKDRLFQREVVYIFAKEEEKK